MGSALLRCCGLKINTEQNCHSRTQGSQAQSTTPARELLRVTRNLAHGAATLWTDAAYQGAGVAARLKGLVDLAPSKRSST